MERLYAALERVPLFRNVRQEDIKLELLGGALTNVSYKVTTGGAAYVLRLAGEGTSDYIDRAAEKHNAQVAAEAGVNAEVVYFDAREGTMVTRFVEGVCMNAGDGFCRDSGAPVRAARALKRVHSLGRLFRSRFDVFAAIDGYLDLLRGWRTPVPEDYYEVGRRARAVRLALEASPAALVPCHNDPWPGNLLDADGRIYLIDWEYSGMNDPLWDLADLSVEAEVRARARPHHDGGLLRGQIISGALLAAGGLQSDERPALVRLGFRPARERQPRGGFPELRTGKARALQSADERRRFQPAPERGAYGRLATLLPALRHTGSLFTQLRRDQRRRSWPEISRLDFGFLPLGLF